MTTVNNKNLVAHMSLISKKISLQGVPGFEEIRFEDWQKQCQHEFKNNIIKQVTYSGLKMISATNTHVMFKTFEKVDATDGSGNAQGIEVLLEKEEDGIWRLIQSVYCHLPKRLMMAC